GGKAMESVLNIILFILSVFIIIIIGMQGAKSEDASSAIMGGSSDSKLFAESKDRGIDLFLNRATIIAAVSFFVLVITIWVLK
ncbi:MAG: preprotein translocase subunit SecG, partial [Culicoidibacterales bacterium]